MDAVVLGRIGYDLYSEEPCVPLPRVRRFSRYLGGSSANMAVGLARLGAKVGIVSCLGDDSLSEFLVDFLGSQGVDASHVQRAPGFLPSLCLTEVTPPDRFPQVFYRKEAVDTRLAVTGADLDFIASARFFITNGTSLCASPSRESTYKSLEHAKRSGCLVVFDVDYRSMSWASPEEAGLAVRLALPFIDVLIGNQPELMLVSGRRDLDAAVGALREAGVPMLVSKLGEQGTRVWGPPTGRLAATTGRLAAAPVTIGEEAVFLPPYSVDVVSTIGAGDGFASGFLYALLGGRPVADCLHYGNAAAAIVVSRLSCSEAMPTLAEVEDMIRRQRS